MRILIIFLGIISSSYCETYSFPDGFKFGAATAAYQIEGAWNVSGKGPSIWDTIAHTTPELVVDGSTGDIACDSYHLFKLDVELLKKIGVNFYRFSISWSRILPNGKTDFINPDGIRYYNELIDELLANDIVPMATMSHFDWPQAIEEEGGFLNEAFADYFEDYANVLYENFGDRVKEWITFNEPAITCKYTYTDDMYQCGRVVLLANAKAYHLYNNNYKENQGGRVGITLNTDWHAPLTDSEEDLAISDMAMEFNLGWFAHPIYTEEGDYPPIMKERIAMLSEEEGFPTSRLPPFSQEEVDIIRGTSDFFGLNHYTTTLCTTLAEGVERPSFEADSGASCEQDPSWEGSQSIYMKVVPWGFRNLLAWIKNKYNNFEVIVTENGFSDGGNLFQDCRRINYHNSYLTSLLEAIYEDGCNITGYTVWSSMDNFEWNQGFTQKFGLYSVDFDDPDRTRTPKMSVYIYKNIIETGQIDWTFTPEGFDECEW